MEDIPSEFDIDDVADLGVDKIKQLTENVLEKTDGIGVTLFMARKFLKFDKEINQEIKYKKFMLLNTIIGLGVLSTGGNFVLKIYDMFTNFTVSLIYILYNQFENLTIIKPFSTRPHSASRFIVCQKLIESKPPILQYLYEFYDRYLNLLNEGQV